MLNCSFSFSRLRWLLLREEVVEREEEVVAQKGRRFSAGGEGGR